jgi:hypothetical protein
MKKLLVLVVVLAFVSLTSATPLMQLVGNVGNTSFSINMLAPGMSAAHDGSGIYFVITGVNTDSGALTAALPGTANLSSANEGDAGDTGLVDYGLGTYGEFRVGVPNTLTYNYVLASPATWADSYTLAAGATEVGAGPDGPAPGGG